MAELNVLTLTNEAFAKLARNLIESMRRAGYEGTVIVGTPKGHSVDLPHGCIRMESNFHAPKSHQRWLQGDGFTALCRVKMDLILQLLESGKEVLYCDADVSWRKDIIPLCACENYDASFTCGNPPSGICMGLARIRPTDASRYIFRKVGTTFVDDETCVFNRIRCGERPDFSYQRLPLDIFPNKLCKPTGRSVCYHANGLEYERKVSRMKEYGFWLLG